MNGFGHSRSDLGGARARAACAVALSTLTLSGPGNAQPWIQFEDRIWGFSINFPREPTSERIDYTTHLGETVPARRYHAAIGTARYTLTAVHFAHAPIDAHTAISFAAQAIRDRGRPTYYAFDSLDGIPGQMISVTEPEGRLIQASVYFVDQRLYIIEGNVAAEDAAPSQFVQSIVIIGPEGEQIVREPD